MSRKIAEEVFEEIKKRNVEENLNSIPHSDEFINFIAASIGIGVDLSKKVINILVNAHKIFTIEIVAEDTMRSIPRIEGYVVTDLALIKKLKYIYQDEMVRLYENEFYKRKSYLQIVKELLPIMKSYNNTPIGQVFNKAIMMGELERLLEKSYGEYTEDWKEQNLNIELSKAKFDEEADVKESDVEEVIEDETESFDEEKSGRAVDSKNYNDFIPKSKKYPLDRILKIYGIDFFLRVYMRSYKFSYLIDIVEEGNIFKKTELMLIREMLHKLKLNFDKDPKLKDYRDDIYGLERSVAHNLYFTDKHKHRRD